MGENLHAEPLKNFGKRLPDLAGSDDADRFAVYIKTEKTVDREIILADTAECAVQTPGQAKQEPDRIFRNRIRRIFRNTDHIQPFAGSAEIHVVEAGAAHGNELDPVFD